MDAELKCGFCAEPNPTDLYVEDETPLIRIPCCADEDACYARMMAR